MPLLTCAEGVATISVFVVVFMLGCTVVSIIVTVTVVGGSVTGAKVAPAAALAWTAAMALEALATRLLLTAEALALALAT